MSKRPLGYLLVAAVQCAFLVPAAILRPIDGDEGFYALAAALSADGRLPYEDFAYLQSPLLPFAYGAWTAVWGESWYGLRLLSVLMAIGLGLLLYHHVSARTSSTVIGFAGVLLYASSQFVLQWYSVVKTYAFSTFLLFAAYVLVVERPPGRWRWLAAGAMVALAIDVRLLFAAAVPVFLVHALLGSRSLRDRANAAIAFMGGLLLGLLPSLYFLILDPGRFLFETLEYQRNRSGEDFWGAAGDKLTLFGDVLRDNPQFTALILAAVVASIWMALSRRWPPLALAIAGALGLASMLPTPTFGQYFSTLVPFLVVGVLEVATDRRSPPQRVVAVLGALAVAAYVTVGAVKLDQTVYPSTESSAAKLSSIRDVASTIDANTRPGEVVLAFWPGHLYGTHARPLPGLENDFAPMVINSVELSRERAVRYRLASIYDLIRVIRSRRLRMIVWSPALGITNSLVEANLYLPRPDTFHEAGYQGFRTIHNTTVYLRQPKEARLATRNGRAVILFSSGREVEVAPGALRGFVEGIAPDAGGLSISGWAADARRRRPVDRLMVFSGGRLTVAGPTSAPRPDIAKSFGAGTEWAGFSLRAVTEEQKDPPNPADVRVFAVSGGVASELKRLR